MSETETFVERLKRSRLERGMTQEEMARLLDVTVFTVSGWERGASVPSRLTQEAIWMRVSKIPAREGKR